jgi:hypothetical protein
MKKNIQINADEENHDAASRTATACNHPLA